MCMYTMIYSTEIYIHPTEGKGKAIPLQASTGPEVSRRLSLPDFPRDTTVGRSRDLPTSSAAP